MAMTTKKTTLIAPQVVVPGPKLERLHDGSRVFGILHSISVEEDCRIAQTGKRRVVLPLEPDLSEFIGQAIILMMNRAQCLVRLQGHNINGVPVDGAEEPQPEQATPRPQPHKAPVLAAVEEIRANLPNKCVETNYGEDLPAILAALQEEPRRTVEIAMICSLSDEAARRRLKLLAESGQIEHEKITRIVNKRSYEFDTKRWQLVKTKTGEVEPTHPFLARGY